MGVVVLGRSLFGTASCAGCILLGRVGCEILRLTGSSSIEFLDVVFLVASKLSALRRRTGFPKEIGAVLNLLGCPSENSGKSSLAESRLMIRSKNGNQRKSLTTHCS